MSKQLTTLQQSGIAPVSELENFMVLINKEPEKKYAIVNKMAQGAKYLTIRYLEQKLDELFFGLWKSETTDTKVVGNEYVVTVQLSYFHPITGQWVSRTGIGSVPIQQKRGAAITDLDAKYVNALQKNAPAAKAFAFKNAAKSIGPAFGRDLNAGEDDMPEFEPGTTQAIKAESEMDKAKQEIANAATVAELSPLFAKYRRFPDMAAAVMDRRKELNETNAA